MLTNSGSNPRVRSSSSTNTQGSPPQPATYIAFAELELAYPVCEPYTSGGDL